MAINRVVTVQLTFPKGSSTCINAIVNEIHIALSHLKELGVEGSLINMNYNEYESFEDESRCGECASNLGDDS